MWFERVCTGKKSRQLLNKYGMIKHNVSKDIENFI